MRAAFLTPLVFTALSLSACGTTETRTPPPPPPCTPGSLGCSCSGGTCDAGATCTNNQCVDPCPDGTDGCECRPLGACDAPLTCVGGTCSCDPGTLDCPCDAGGICEGTLACNAGTCECPAGADGCDCLPGNACNGAPLMCIGGRCLDPACPIGSTGCPCNGTSCDTGNSCLINTCVADGSLMDGDTCLRAQQCDTGHCQGRQFVCRPPCADFYQGSTCAPGRFCLPADDSFGQLAGGCVPSECTTNPSCNPGEICVSVAPSANTCFDGCQVSWAGGNYNDNCGGTPIDPRYCTPMGDSGAGELVCFASTAAAGNEGDPCDAITAHCGAELMCFEGHCRRHCDLTSPSCPATETCCTESSAMGFFTVCRPACM